MGGREYFMLIIIGHGQLNSNNRSTTKKDSIPMRMIKLLLERGRRHDHEAMRRCAIEYLWNMFREFPTPEFWISS